MNSVGNCTIVYYFQKISNLLAMVFRFSEKYCSFFPELGFSSRKWADIISKVASRIYFFIIMTQVPLFRFPCRIGVCQTPVDITACQLIASDSFPQVVVKTLLYPGAIKRSFVEGTTIPSHDQLLDSYKSNMKESPAITDLRHLEVLAGSYLCVAGSILGLTRRGRMSLFGLTLILWGISTEMFTRKRGTELTSEKALCIYPEMLITIVFAFFSSRRDLRKLIRSCELKKRLKNKLKPRHN